MELDVNHVYMSSIHTHMLHHFAINGHKKSGHWGHASCQTQRVLGTLPAVAGDAGDHSQQLVVLVVIGLSYLVGYPGYV